MPQVVTGPSLALAACCEALAALASQSERITRRNLPDHECLETLRPFVETFGRCARDLRLSPPAVLRDMRSALAPIAGAAAVWAALIQYGVDAYYQSHPGGLGMSSDC
jgi:hypothetical protein